MGHLGGHSPPKMLAANTREAGKVEMAAQQPPLPGHWVLLTEVQESHLQKGQQHIDPLSCFSVKLTAPETPPHRKQGLSQGGIGVLRPLKARRVICLYIPWLVPGKKVNLQHRPVESNIWEA